MPDSSPAVSAKTTKSELVPNRGWVRICLLFAILYNVAGHPEADTSALSTFNDKNQVAAYAVNGFAWAVSNKVVGGTSNTTLYEIRILIQRLFPLEQSKNFTVSVGELKLPLENLNIPLGYLACTARKRTFYYKRFLKCFTPKQC